MGRIVTSDHTFQGVAESNIKAFVTQTTGKYQKLFSSNPPTFATYYSLSVTEGSVEPTLRGADEIIGRDSPLKYSRIENMPLYGNTQFDLNREIDENLGAQTGEVGGDAFLLPGSIEPRENDYFVLEHTQSRVMFRVTAVNVDRIEGRGYHKITFILDEGMKTEEQINDQLAEHGEYEFDMDGLGTHETPPIIQKIGKRLRNELAEVLDALKQWYITKYYYEKYGALLHLSTDSNRYFVHDQMLEHFIRKNEVFHTKRYLHALSLPAPDPWYMTNYGRLSGYYTYEMTKQPRDQWLDRWQIKLDKTATHEFTNRLFGTPKGFYYSAQHKQFEQISDLAEIRANSQRGVQLKMPRMSQPDIQRSRISSTATSTCTGCLWSTCSRSVPIPPMMTTTRTAPRHTTGS